MAAPRLFLTSMSGPGEVQNMTEMLEPILSYLDGVTWVLHDCPPDDPGARYLETVKGAGKVIHRPWPRGRHFASMNDTLWCGDIQEGDFVIWTDTLERPAPEFLARVKTEIIPMMDEADLDVLSFYGKAYLFRYRETLEYRNSPHWTLTGHNGRGIEWANIEPDEKKVRLNVRPIKRADQPYHWVGHLLKYHIAYPAGSNSALLGLDHWSGGQTQENWIKRETNRLALRAEMRRRGYPLTVDGFVAMCRAGLDETLKGYLRADKVFSDAYWHLVQGRTEGLKDSHNPNDAIPIE